MSSKGVVDFVWNFWRSHATPRHREWGQVSAGFHNSTLQKYETRNDTQITFHRIVNKSKNKIKFIASFRCWPGCAFCALFYFFHLPKRLLSKNYPLRSKAIKILSPSWAPAWVFASWNIKKNSNFLIIENIWGRNFSRSLETRLANW